MTDFASDSILVLLDVTPSGELAKSSAGLLGAAAGVGTPVALVVSDAAGLGEAAAALGCPKWRIITLICYRASISGIITGVLLAIARISGETAPLLFTALNNQFMSMNMNGPIANLPVVIFQYAASPFEDWNRLAWAGAVMITILVLGINILARSLFRNK